MARAPTVARPRLLQAVIDAFQQADVRRKIVFTLALLVLFRFTANLPVPGVETSALADIFKKNAVPQKISVCIIISIQQFFPR